MTRLIHLSDLHFGRDRPELMRPLLTAVNDLGPDIVAISGDLTQRARSSQFRAARTFIDHIEAPVLCVPGNHDLPAHRPIRRFLNSFANYKRHISPDLAPSLLCPDLAVIGINTNSPFRWQSGWASRRGIRKAAELCRSGPEHRLNVVVAHHPFEMPEESHKRPMFNAEWGLACLAEAGAHVVLSGHLHRWRVIGTDKAEGPGIIQIHCGTGLSTRQRGEPNDFAVLEIEGNRPDSALTVTRWIAGPENRFSPREQHHFERKQDRWQARPTEVRAGTSS
ncbi:possible phospodiesterase [Pseudooceanicola batsensis HTCC2597]|uniref:Possible phospodiesterase n=1 Tax=Pseudooceanicola batsensis (strain ATCC BAA-863 / DSM 15984 / KCTC 12145 / HTCC2597) TaxID=252305 RepID=A3U3S7_PSEBH|nr:metallophosphoesterase [Pseudooceanicola batsensis]EAQ01166.1 possible phospodiesterase [Pseudooceanicola batsensis HTCC2597]